MESHGIPLKTMEYHGMTRNTMKYHGMTWNDMEYQGDPWKAMQYDGVPSYTKVYLGMIYPNIVFHGIACIPWYNIIHLACSTCPLEAGGRHLGCLGGVAPQYSPGGQSPPDKTGIKFWTRVQESGLQTRLRWWLQRCRCAREWRLPGCRSDCLKCQISSCPTHSTCSGSDDLPCRCRQPSLLGKRVWTGSWIANLIGCFLGSNP